MSGLFFLWPGHWPLALLALPAGAALWFWRRAREQRLQRALGARTERLVGAPAAARWRWAADAAVVLLLGVAVLEPATPGDVGEAGGDVALCVDVSWSMAARDVTPSRLALAQQAIARFAATASDTRAALVAYAGEALVAAPLTADLAAVATLADELAPGAHGRAGTDPGAAIDRAVALLQRGGRAGAVVMLSDGEDFAGGALAAARRAAAAGYPVHALGLGTAAGGKIVVDTGAGEAFLQDGAGVDVVTRGEFGALAAWAEAGGGRSVPLADGDGLRALHDGVLAPAAREAAVRAGRLQPLPLWRWPLFAAVALWMLAACAQERRR